MLGISTTSGETLPLLISLALFAYAVLFPLQVGAAVLSRKFASQAGRLGLYAAGVVSAAYELSLLINSGLGPLSALGSLMFLCLVVGTAIIILRTVILRAIRTLPKLASFSGSALYSLRLQLSWYALYFRSDR